MVIPIERENIIWQRPENYNFSEDNQSLQNLTVRLPTTRKICVLRLQGFAPYSNLCMACLSASKIIAVQNKFLKYIAFYWICWFDSDLYPSSISLWLLLEHVDIFSSLCFWKAARKTQNSIHFIGVVLEIYRVIL